MALWGLTDNLAGAPKWLTPTVTFTGGAAANVVEANKLVLAGHPFETGDSVTYTKGGTTVTNLVTGTIYFVRRIADKANEIELYDTKARAEATGATTGRLGIGANSGSADDHTLQLTPSDIYYVDGTEAGLAANRKKGFQTPGWYRYVQKDAGEFSSSTFTISGAAVTGTGGVFSCTASALRVGDKVVITGTDSNSKIASYTTGDDYIVTAIGAGTEGSNVTAFTLQEDGSAITTVVGAASTIAGLTFTVSPSIERNQAELLCAIKDTTPTAFYSGDQGVDGDDDAVVTGGVDRILLTTQPTALLAQTNEAAAVFTVTVSGSVTPTFQWSRATAVDGTFTNISNSDGNTTVATTSVTVAGTTNTLKTSTLTFADNGANNGATAGSATGAFYKCTITGSGVTTVVSDIVQLTVNS